MRTPLYRLSLCTMIFGAILLSASSSPAQQAVTTAPVSVVPHLIKFSGALPGASNKAETVDVKFSLYAAQTGGEALWTETQQVSLDPSGKYSVLLGSVAALPDSAFAQGQARWIGVTLGSEQESARTILVATPYSLKASDSETLGGHPASDFTLKNALPASGTDITQINVGSGITGGGTGPTVTLGLSSSYLESLGNNIYPQLAGTNTLTGKNTYSSGKLFIGSAPVLSTANIIAGSEVVLSTSGSNVTVGVNGPGLLKLANGYYPQLGTANTFTGNEVVNSAAGEAVYATSSFPGGAGFYGVAEGSYSAGVAGFGDVGFYGVATGGLAANAGVLGVYEGYSGEYETVSSGYGGSIGVGVWGDASSDNGMGIVGTTDTDNGVAGYTAASYAAIYAQSDYTSGASGGYLFGAYSSVTNQECLIDNNANLSCDGSFAVSNLTPDQHRVETYNVQSSENWIEDFGSGDLQSGHAVITLDPTFAKIVNTGVAYHVFLTPNGDSKGLYVTSRGTNSFEVRESSGGTSNMSFDYRIVAKRAGKESLRLVDVTERRRSQPATRPRNPEANGKARPAAKPGPGTTLGARMTNINSAPVK